MYLTKSVRTFFGTNAERTASGLAAFLPGDEYYETDTTTTYVHDGMQWREKGGGGSVAGSDTQIQYNNGGTFGGASGFTWNDSTNTIGHTKSTATTLETFLSLSQTGAGGAYINIAAGAASGRIGMRSTFFDISTSSPVLVTGSTVGLAASTDITFDPGGYAAIKFRGGATPEAVFNENADSGYAFRIETANNDHMVYVDPANDAFQIGTTTAGNIADFRSAAIVFNEAGADLDIRFEGDTETNLFYLDAGNNRIGIKTATPGAELDVNGSIWLEGTQVFTGSSGEISRDEDGLGMRIIAASTQNNGASLEFYGRDHPSLAGNCYLNFGGYNGTGTLYFRQRKTSSYATYMYIDSNGSIFGNATTGTFVINSMTTTQRNALTATNGMVVYNTTTNKLQVRASGAWVDLH